MSHERVTRLPAAGKTRIPTWILGRVTRLGQESDEDDVDPLEVQEEAAVRWAASSGHRGRAIGERIAQQALPGQSHCFFGNDQWWEPGGGGG